MSVGSRFLLNSNNEWWRLVAGASALVHTMLLYTWSDVISRSLQDLSLGIVKFIPNVLVAIVVLVFGWVVGAILGKIISQLVRALKVDNALRGAGLEALLHKGNMRLDMGAFLGGLAKWFVVIVFLIAAFDVLGLHQVNIFLQQVVLLFLPQVIISVLVLLVAAIIAETMKSIVVSSAQAADIAHAHFLGTVTKWAIWTFAILTALFQLGVATVFIETLFTGVIIALSLAVGLAFGLGGQQAAAEYITKIQKELSGKKK